MEIFPPSPSLHPSIPQGMDFFLFVRSEKRETFFLSLSLFSPRKRARRRKNWTRRRTKGEGIHRGEVWRAPRCPGTVVVEGFSKETYGGLYSVYTRGRLKSIFPARSGPHRTKPGGTMDRPMCTLAGHENNGWNCSRFNTDLFPFPAR